MENDFWTGLDGPASAYACAAKPAPPGRAAGVEPYGQS
jgi:hypothetical protein